MAIHTRPTVGLVAVVAAALALCAGCSGHPGPGAPESNTRADSSTLFIAYSAAMDETAECVADRGWDVGPVTTGPSGLTLGFDIGVEAGDGDPDRDFKACAAKHLDTAELAYLDSLRATGAELDRALREFGTCLVEAGIEGLPSNPAEQQVTAALAAFEAGSPESDAGWACFDRYVFVVYGVNA